MRRLIGVRSGNPGVPSPAAMSTFELGATTQSSTSLAWWGDPTAVATANTAMNQACRWRNQHICSFGALSPEETAGTRDWSSLDELVNENWPGAENLNLTLAMAPSWMAGGTSGTTDWDTINEVAPLPEDFDDFASLCAAAAARYTQCSTFHVWNELKGFWNDAENRPDDEGYTAMYNAVWAAVKAVRPDAKLGGPYGVVITRGGTQSHPSTELAGDWGAADQQALDTIKYWLANKTGGDFIALDGGNMVADNVELVTPMQAAEQIVPAMVAWLRGLDPGTYPGCDTLPIVFAEWYIWGAHWEDTQPSHAQTAATWLVGTLAAARAGVTRAFVWEPMGDANGDLAPYSPMGLVTDVTAAGGGQPTELQAAAKIVHDRFSNGAALYDVNAGNSNIYALGTTDKAVLVNKTGSSQSTSGFTPATTLTAWEIALVDWTP